MLKKKKQKAKNRFPVQQKTIAKTYTSYTRADKAGFDAVYRCKSFYTDRKVSTPTEKFLHRFYTDHHERRKPWSE